MNILRFMGVRFLTDGEESGENKPHVVGLELAISV